LRIEEFFVPRENRDIKFEPPLAKTSWQRRAKWPVLVLLLAAVVWLAPKGDVRLHGQVEQNGQPMANVVITLYAADDGPAWNVTTDEFGRFDTAESDSAALVATDYRVTLTAAPAATAQIPQRFQQLTTTPLRVQLKAGNNSVRFNVPEER
jgi:5-hydroxyisourate hydrolase-like protein (transthyretin family)